MTSPADIHERSSSIWPEAERVVVLGRTLADAQSLSRPLESAGFECAPVGTLGALIEAVRAGCGAAVLVRTALAPEALEELQRALAEQPNWSDLPLIVLVDVASPDGAQTSLARALLLDRRRAMQTLPTAVGTAIRDRRRQYALRRAGKERERLVAHLAHSLRTPLGAVIFASDLLGRDPQPQEAERYRKIIGRQSRNLSRLLDELLEEARPIAAPEARANPPKDPLHLVLVEDSPDICDALSDLLRFEGHDVQVAHDGPHGVELIERMHPDLALIDIGLPGLDGYQVAQQIRKDLGQEVQLVALTGYGQPEDVARARSAGFDRHLKKPIDVDALSNLLHELSATRHPAVH